MSDENLNAIMRPRKSDDVLTRRTEDKSFLFNTATNELFHVNRTGGRILELLDGTNTIEETVKIVCTEFRNANPERVRRVLPIFIKQLSDRKLLLP